MGEEERILMYEDGEIKVFFAKLDAEKIKPNPHNPNVMNQFDMEGLKKNIANYGYIEPIVVAPYLDDSGEQVFLILDGEHRYRVLTEEYNKTIIPVLIVEGLSDLAIITGAYSLNKFRGKIDTDKLREMIRNVIIDYGDTAIKEIAQLTQLSQQNIAKLIEGINKNVQKIAETIKQENPKEQIEKLKQEITPQQTTVKEEKTEEKEELKQPDNQAMQNELSTKFLSIALSEADYERVVNILSRISKDLGEALIKVVNFYVEYGGIQ